MPLHFKALTRPADDPSHMQLWTVQYSLHVRRSGLGVVTVYRVGLNRSRHLTVDLLTTRHTVGRVHRSDGVHHSLNLLIVLVAYDSCGWCCRGACRSRRCHGWDTVDRRQRLQLERRASTAWSLEVSVVDKRRLRRRDEQRLTAHTVVHRRQRLSRLGDTCLHRR